MSSPAPSNLAHSVFQRLRNYAKEHGEDFNRLLSRYAMERFLYRQLYPPCWTSQPRNCGAITN